MKNTTFRLRLAQMREERNLSQADLGKLIGVDKSTVANYESGLRFPRKKELIAICDLFGVSADYIMGRSNIKHMAALEVALTNLPKHLQELLTEKDALPAMEFVHDCLEADIDVNDLKAFLVHLVKIRQKIIEFPPEKW